MQLWNEMGTLEHYGIDWSERWSFLEMDWFQVKLSADTHFMIVKMI